MAAEPAAASAAAAISAVMDWRSSPDARAAAFAYLESVCATPRPRQPPLSLRASLSRVCFWSALVTGVAAWCRELAWLMPLVVAGFLPNP